MRIDRLELRAFRSYDRASVQFPEGITVIHGENARGKTNILEAVYIMCCGKSHRARSGGELIKDGSPAAIIGAAFTDGAIHHKAVLKLDEEGRKSIKLDGKRCKKTSELVGRLKCVLFAPDNISIVKDGAALRRGFMDIALSQIYPSYLGDLSDYSRVLAQRNALLREHKPDEAMNSVYEAALARYGAGIMEKRQELCRLMAEKAGEYQYKLSTGRDILSLSYEPSIRLEGGDAEQVLLEGFRSSRPKDIYRGFTTAGPQRDDIRLEINGMSARSLASQGQQRTCALSIKLAELDFMREATGKAPVLLLDDVFGELDLSRREKLLESVRDCQAIITCTNAEALPLDVSRVEQSISVEMLYEQLAVSG